MEDILLLSLIAFIAGLVDAVVGGGGLIQIPALFSVMPNAIPATLFGTNKLAAITGTSLAAWRYAKGLPVQWGATLPAAISAFIFSFIGARTVSILPIAIIRPIVLVLLIAVAIYTFWNKDFGSIHAPKLSGNRERVFALGLGGLIGFYDGFFGPGTGSFLIFLFIRVFGFSFLGASAAAKIVNVATNLAALIYFGFAGQILLYIALPMAVCNGFGSAVGTRLALKRGSGFVRILFLIVVTIMIAKFGYDTLK